MIMLTSRQIHEYNCYGEEGLGELDSLGDLSIAMLTLRSIVLYG